MAIIASRQEGNSCFQPKSYDEAIIVLENITIYRICNYQGRYALIAIDKGKSALVENNMFFAIEFDFSKQQ